MDWFGYLSCVSPLALKEFEETYGYKLSSEEFIDQGYYNTPYRIPSIKHLDGMEFVQKFVSGFIRVVVTGITDGDGPQNKIIEMNKGFNNVDRIEFLPFNTLGEHKYHELNIPLRIKEIRQLENSCKSYEII